MCFDINSRHKPQQIWFICYPNTKSVPYEASDAVVPVQFDFYIKTQCLPDMYLFLIRAEGKWGITYLFLRPGIENNCNMDPNRLRISAGIIWDMTMCRWDSVYRRCERKGCLHFLSSSGQRTISYVKLFSSYPHQVWLFPPHVASYTHWKILNWS